MENLTSSGKQLLELYKENQLVFALSGQVNNLIDALQSAGITVNMFKRSAIDDKNAYMLVMHEDDIEKATTIAAQLAVSNTKQEIYGIYRLDEYQETFQDTKDQLNNAVTIPGITASTYIELKKLSGEIGIRLAAKPSEIDPVSGQKTYDIICSQEYLKKLMTILPLAEIQSQFILATVKTNNIDYDTSLMNNIEKALADSKSQDLVMTFDKIDDYAVINKNSITFYTTQGTPGSNKRTPVELKSFDRRKVDNKKCYEELKKFVTNNVGTATLMAADAYYDVMSTNPTRHKRNETFSKMGNKIAKTDTAHGDETITKEISKSVQRYRPVLDFMKEALDKQIIPVNKEGKVVLDAVTKASQDVLSDISNLFEKYQQLLIDKASNDVSKHADLQSKFDKEVKDVFLDKYNFENAETTIFDNCLNEIKNPSQIQNMNDKNFKNALSKISNMKVQEYDDLQKQIDKNKGNEEINKAPRNNDERF